MQVVNNSIKEHVLDGEAKLRLHSFGLDSSKPFVLDVWKDNVLLGGLYFTAAEFADIVQEYHKLSSQK